MNRTKAELYEELQKMRHLSEAVEAKDLEIYNLKKEKEKAMKRLQEENKKLEGEIAKNNKDVSDLEKLLIENKTFRETNEKLINFINSYVNSTRNYLKSQQGNLDNMIELEAMLSEIIGGK